MAQVFRTPKALLLSYFEKHDTHPIAIALNSVLAKDEEFQLDGPTAICEFLYAVRGQRMRVPSGQRLKAFMRHREELERCGGSGPAPRGAYRRKGLVHRKPKS
jgi:hypothetical protein